MTMAPTLRKFALTIHLISSVGWIGAVMAYLALGIAAVRSSDAQTVRAAWTAMELAGWWVTIPLAIAALLTGLVMSLGTHWGLFRHYWVLISLLLTVLCTVVLVLHMPTVSAMASRARQVEGADLRALGGDLFHPGVGLVVLLAITVLNIYKPAGVTPYGWREQRRALQHHQARQEMRAGVAAGSR
jgi:NADH:ubiquinone oxidoreductase subunit 6 (subunit J)